MGVWRLAAPLAIFSLVDLGVLRAERLQERRHAAVHDAAGAASAPRRRCLLAVALFGAAASPACARPATVEEVLGGEVLESFKRLDFDGDQRLSREEYEALLGDIKDTAAQLAHWTTYHEADVDGDDVLNLQEYVFSRFLATASLFRKGMEAQAQEVDGLPPDFIDRLDDMFLQLRQHGGGGVRFPDLWKALCKVFDQPTNTPVPDDNEKMLELFVVADIIPDGTLNMNELDFYHFLVREDLFARHMPAPVQDENEVIKLFEVCDKNRDGHITYPEAGSLVEHLGSSNVAEQAFFRDRVGTAFHLSDLDENGVIDHVEADRFIRVMLKGK